MGSGWRFKAILFGAWMGAAYLILPMLVIFPVSLTDKRFLSLPSLDKLSLRHYETLLEPTWLSSIGQSIVIGVGCAIVSVTLGTLAAIGLWRMRSALSDTLFGLLVLPLVVPPIATALGMYGVWHRLGLFDSYLGTILAHSAWAVGFVVVTVYAGLSNIDRSWERAARSLGASAAQSVWWVIVPNVMPGILSGALFAFVISWDEVILTLFVTSREINTLPKQIFVAIRDNVDPAIASAASGLVVLTMVAVAFQGWVAARRQRGKNAI
ncbi:ABC transporter permease [Limibacillus sp. MBR-115]|jgi:putative spermidine/putrescine transport system permease protein|uniref:ABC transporter permease n=1 Tax=Limibacillus sp. MBR-115 TaxID=3156465 RepID=UPI003391CB82